MTKQGSYRNNEVKRRGDVLPGRLRIAAHRGVTLVELMISMLILAIVCTSWFKILSIQSAKREALRREGVERLAGMMEAFIAAFSHDNYKVINVSVDNKIVDDSLGDFQEGDAILYDPDALIGNGGYMFTRLESSKLEAKVIRPIFSEEEIREGRLGAASPGYRLHVGTLGTDMDSAMNINIVKDGQTDAMMESGAKILVGDLFESAGEIDRADTPRRICRFKLFLRNTM